MDADDAPPPIDPAAFDRLRAALAAAGPAAAADSLIAELRAAGDLNGLFYALLLKKRVELGVSPFPTGPATDLPAHTHEPYEEAIRAAAREVGRLALDRGDLTKAWQFYRLINEPEPVKLAIENFEPGPEADIYPIIEIAWQQGLYPKKGFDLILDRHGVCSAITTVSGSELNQNPDLRDYCVGRLTRALHAQLADRLRADLSGRGAPARDGASVREMVEGHPELFGDDAYHIDTSHLSSVCQMALYLPPGEENALARELCVYGERLSPNLRGGGGDAPFEDGYADYRAYLDTVAGVDVEANLARFREKAKRESDVGASYAAQVYVNLLVKLNRLPEALAAAREFLANEEERGLICPSASELARRLNDYAALADAAKARHDAVQFLAGLIAGSGVYPPVAG
ncbi:hypothetical protein [Urbifossiella limnaea]|uniref:Uncharacterized protein n=1 Tax=Urbifossiella limnaea TaxID=2528023 RepID=A0A517XZA5_9BACT|nr:hypothetical protein [Urbifossiella limnaea]QDU22839.1 hypothetical protein ETAA1_48270 [Urbifossiella limnaea]